MQLDVIIFILRILIALALYVFLAVVAYFVWRDIQSGVPHSDFADFIPTASLVVIECDEDVPLALGQRFALRSTTTMGRSPTNAIVFPDPFASTRHATLTYHRGQWWLDDHQSRNGTTVNDIPVTGTVVVSSGDIIGIGRARLRLELSDRPAGPVPSEPTGG